MTVEGFDATQSRNGETIPGMQVCRMNIMFPVDSDDMAIAIKKAIGEVLAGLPTAQFNFLLSGMKNPPQIPPE